MCGRKILIRRLAEPFDRLLKILPNALPGIKTHAQIVLSENQALPGGFLQPLDRFGIILLNALPAVITLGFPSSAAFFSHLTASA